MDEIGEFLQAVDAIDGLVHDAKAAAFGTDVKVDATEVLIQLDTLEDVAARLRLPDAVVVHIDELKAEMGGAEPGARHRVKKEAVYDALDGLRARFPPAVRHIRGAEEKARTHDVELTAEADLLELVRRVEANDEILRIVRAGTVVAELRRPRP